MLSTNALGGFHMLLSILIPSDNPLASMIERGFPVDTSQGRLWVSLVDHLLHLETTDLCIFLSALATTSGTQFNSLTTQLGRLREVLLEEVVRDSSDSETGVSEEDTDAETLEETLSDSSTEGESQDDKSEISVKEISRPQTVEKEKEATLNNHRVMVSLQRGARYELEERLVRQVFSKFGKVMRMILYEKPVSGAWGFIGLF